MLTGVTEDVFELTEGHVFRNSSIFAEVRGHVFNFDFFKHINEKFTAMGV